MTPLLRNSNKVAGQALTRPFPSICRSCISRLRPYELPIAISRIQRYSTEPPKQKTGQQGHAGATSSGKKPSRAIGKPARGFERLYKSGGPLSFSRASVKDVAPSEHSPATPKALPEGRVALTDAERKTLDSMIGKIRQTFPSSTVNSVESFIRGMAKNGMPAELRPLLKEISQSEKLSMAHAWQVVRIAWKFAGEEAARFSDSEQKLKDEMFSQNDGKKSSLQDSNEQTSEQGSPKSSQGPKSNQGDPKGGFKLSTQLDGTTILVAGLTAYLAWKFYAPGESSKEITFQEFKTAFLDKGLVVGLSVVNSSSVRVDLDREGVGRLYPESPARQVGFRYFFTIGSVEAFERKLDEAQEDLSVPSSQRIPVKYMGKTFWSQVFLSFGPTVLIVGLLIWASRRAGGGGGSSSGIFSLGKSKAKKFNAERDINIRFKDVAGMDEAKAEIMEFVSFLKEPGQYQKLGAKIPRGALLSGPPGTGKTMLAKATAGESGVPFFSISGSEFVEIFVGVGASRVRDLFQTARKSTPCIIFIDEIDAVGKSRAKSSGFGGNDEREGTLNQILTEMDGFNTSEQVVVLAGTNRPDVLDKALLRPGRFDRHISIDAPTMDGRKQIFKVHLNKITTKEEMDNLTGRLAALTPGFSGADIANCVNEAALIGKQLILIFHSHLISMLTYDPSRPYKC